MLSFILRDFSINKIWIVTTHGKMNSSHLNGDFQIQFSPGLALIYRNLLLISSFVARIHKTGSINNQLEIKNSINSLAQTSLPTSKRYKI